MTLWCNLRTGIAIVKAFTAINGHQNCVPNCRITAPYCPYCHELLLSVSNKYCTDIAAPSDYDARAVVSNVGAAYR